MQGINTTNPNAGLFAVILVNTRALGWALWEISKYGTLIRIKKKR
jgi:hypothetical protein